VSRALTLALLALAVGCGTRRPIVDAATTTAAATTIAGPTSAASTTTIAPTTTPAPTTTSSEPATTARPTPLMTRIAQLTVAADVPVPGYSRRMFGSGWADANGNGCRTRCEVLARDRRTDLAGLPNGGWLSAYDGYTTDNPAELDIDHVVPLEEAWRSGAATWTPAHRVAYANNLDDPTALVAVTAASNRAKGSRDPAIWQPSNRADWCAYVAAWVNVKLTWSLTADPAEVRALTNMASGCP